MNRERLQTLVPLVARVAAWVIILLAAANIALNLLAPRAASAPTAVTPPPATQPQPVQPQPTPVPTPALAPAPSSPAPADQATPEPPIPDLALALTPGDFSLNFRDGYVRVTSARLVRTTTAVRLEAVVVAEARGSSEVDAPLIGVEISSAVATPAGQWYPLRSAYNLALVKDSEMVQPGPRFPLGAPRAIAIAFPPDVPPGKATLAITWQIAARDTSWGSKRDKTVQVIIP